MNNNFDFWLNEYYKKFGDYFPTENYSCDTEQMIVIIKRCIENDKQIEDQKDVIY